MQSLVAFLLPAIVMAGLVAELLELPCVTQAASIELGDGSVTVKRQGIAPSSRGSSGSAASEKASSDPTGHTKRPSIQPFPLAR